MTMQLLQERRAIREQIAKLKEKEKEMESNIDTNALIQDARDRLRGQEDGVTDTLADIEAAEASLKDCRNRIKQANREATAIVRDLRKAGIKGDALAEFQVRWNKKGEKQARKVKPKTPKAAKTAKPSEAKKPNGNKQ